MSAYRQAPTTCSGVEAAVRESCGILANQDVVSLAPTTCSRRRSLRGRLIKRLGGDKIPLPCLGSSWHAESIRSVTSTTCRCGYPHLEGRHRLNSLHLAKDRRKRRGISSFQARAGCGNNSAHSRMSWCGWAANSGRRQTREVEDGASVDQSKQVADEGDHLGLARAGTASPPTPGEVGE
jgi:hypothetical protein